MARFPTIGSMPDRFDTSGTKICRNCPLPVPEGRRHYCSDSCSFAFFEHHHWPTVRKTILKRDKYRCGICNTRTQSSLLHIDHIMPLHLGGEPFDQRNLRALCKECHLAKTKLDRTAVIK